MLKVGIEPARNSIIRDVMVWVYWTSIVIGMLNFGAVEIQTVALLCVPIFLMIVVGCLANGVPERTRSAVTSVVVLMMLTLMLIGLQTLPLPYGLFGKPAWQDIAVIAPNISHTISLTPGDDWSAALRMMLPFGVFVLGLLLFDTDQRAVGAVKALAISGGVASIMSILQFEMAPETLIFWPKVAYVDSLTGFFVNRNTAATYFGLITLLNFALLIQVVRERHHDHERLRVAWWGRDTRLTIALYALCLLAALVALMLTRSRAGLLASASAVILLVIFHGFRRPQGRTSQNPFSSRRSRPWLRRGLTTVLGLLAMLFVIEMLGGSTLLRAQTHAVDDSRYCVMPGIILAIGNHLPWGSGLGSFEYAFPGYRNPGCGLYGLWNRAHNFYLEGVFTFGLFFFVLAGGAITMLVRFFLTGLVNRKALRFAPEIGLSALLLIAIHSAFDFSLQISGLAVILAALLAPLVTVSLNKAGRRSSKGVKRDLNDGK